MLRIITMLLVFVAGVWLPPLLPEVHTSESAPPTAARIPWSSIELQGSRLGNSVAVSIQLSRLPAAGIEKSFVASPRGRPYAASGPDVFLLDVRTRIEPVAFAPVTLESRVWFKPQEVLPLQRVRTRAGEDDYDQVFRFTNEGVFRRQREPKTPEETPLGPARWTKTVESFYAYPGGSNLTETSLLLYILSTRDLKPKADPLRLVVFNRRQFHEVLLRAGAERSLSVVLSVRLNDGRENSLKSVVAVPISLESRPLDPNAKEKEDFSFLGLKDEIVFYVEKESRLPVQVSGVIPGIGHVELRAREIKLQTSKD